MKKKRLPSTMMHKAPIDIRTICQVHRDIYQILKDKDGSDAEIQLLGEAYCMGKRIAAKLRQYKYDFDDGWYEANKLDGPELDED